MKINISELNRTTGISRPTLIKWKKAGLLESELAKKGFGFEPGAVPDPVTGEVPGDGIALGRQTASLMQSDFKLDPELAALAKHMNDKFGPGSVMYGGIGLPKTEFVSTGVPEIDNSRRRCGAREALGDLRKGVFWENDFGSSHSGAICQERDEGSLSGHGARY